MSLLLDALKKAADDKQKASRSNGETVDRPDKDSTGNIASESDTVSETRSSSDELTLQSIDISHNNFESTTTDDPDNVQDLTLEIDGAEDRLITEPYDTDNLSLEETASGQEIELENKDSKTKESYISSVQQGDKNDEVSAGRYTISDDALSMLIHKTNRDIKQGKRIWFASVFTVSSAIIVFAGLYYYTDMQAEIATLERKHLIEMRLMQSKTSREKLPEKSEIIRTIVSDADLDKKVQFAKQKMANNKVSANTERQSFKLAETKTRDIQAASSAMSIQKTKSSDPVGDKLDAAWVAYEGGHYQQAKDLYRAVLTMEKNNRDALLGMGAIAVIEKNASVAREIYLSLLKQDPRDPIATAALASLQTGETSLKADEEYMLMMVQKNPDAPHLNFALGNIYAQQNKWRPAQQYYFNAWQHDKKNADYIFNLAVSLDQLNKHQQAITFYKDSLLKSENKQISFSRVAVQQRIKELSVH